MTKRAHQNQGCHQARENKELTAFVSVIMGRSYLFCIGF